MTRVSDLAMAACIWSAAAGMLALWMTRRAARERRLLKEEKMLREELEAYARLDPGLAPHESARTLAKRVCTTVAEHSAFREVAMLMRDVEGRLNVVGSAGVDDLMALAINGRVARFARERRHDLPQAERRKSCPVTLEPMATSDPTGFAGSRRGRQVIILPLWSQAGEMLGALAVWRPVANEGVVIGAPEVALTAKTTPWENELAPLESLAQKLGRSIDFVQMSERLARAEEIAGLGNLAAGLAHELNNPLTAMLGFAELIAATATEPRVREDAVAIVSEAIRMKETVDMLFQLWRPSDSADRAANMTSTLVESMERETKTLA